MLSLITSTSVISAAKHSRNVNPCTNIYLKGTQIVCTFGAFLNNIFAVEYAVPETTLRANVRILLSLESHR